MTDWNCVTETLARGRYLDQSRKNGVSTYRIRAEHVAVEGNYVDLEIDFKDGWSKTTETITLSSGGKKTYTDPDSGKWEVRVNWISGNGIFASVNVSVCYYGGPYAQITDLICQSSATEGDEFDCTPSVCNTGNLGGSFDIKYYEDTTLIKTVQHGRFDAGDCGTNLSGRLTMPDRDLIVTVKMCLRGTSICYDERTVTISIEVVAVGNGFTIHVATALATKTILVAHVVKLPHYGLPGVDPGPDIYYWPEIMGYVGGEWQMVDPSTAYIAQVGSILETIPSFDKTYGTGSFADGIDCVVMALGDSGVGTLLFKEEDVFRLNSGSPTEIWLSNTSNDIISEAFMGPVCDLFGIERGNPCKSFWAEMYDPMFLANYVCIKNNGKDLLGNEREITLFDKIAVPFAILGSLPGLSLLPFGAFVTKGLKTATKFGDDAVQMMLNFSMDASSMVSTKDTWYFLDAIGQVTKAHADEIINALETGDTTLADSLLRKYAGESKGWWDYHALNDMLRDALPADAYNWLRTQIGLTEIGAGTIINTAKKPTLSADDIAKLADAAKDSDVMDEVAKSVSASFSTVDNIVDPVEKAQKLNDLKNIEETIPQAFVGVVDDATKSLTQKLSKTGSEMVNAMPISPASSWDEAADTTALVFDNVLEGLKTKREMLEDPDMFYAFTTFVRDTCVWIVREGAKFDEPLSVTYARMMRVANGVKSSIKEVPETITAMADLEVDAVRAAMIRAFGDIEGNKIVDNAYQLTKFGKAYIQKLLDVLYAGGRLTDFEVTEILTKSSSRETIDEVFEVLTAVSGGDPAVDAALSAKLCGFGGHEKVLGDVLGAKARYFDVVPDATLDEFVGFCVDDANLGLKALGAADPAKMADLIAKHKSILDDVASGTHMSADRVMLLLKHGDVDPTPIAGLINSLDDPTRIVKNLSDGTGNQALGNFIDIVDKHYDAVKGLGDIKANSWVKNNAAIGRKALESTDPAKMADIPHATQEYAASYADVAADMGGTIADDIVKAADDFVDESTSNWLTTGKQTVKNTSDKFWNYYESLSKAGKENIVHIMAGATLVFAAVVLYAIYTKAGPASLNQNLFTKKMDTWYWPCYHACDDKDADTLDEAIKVYETVINECAESLYEYKDEVTADGLYDEFNRTLQLHKFNLSRMKTCLENLQPCGDIHCTSNTNFFYVDLDGDPAGFSYANYEVLLTAVKTGSHKVRIHKQNYSPECSKDVIVTEGTPKTFNCDMYLAGDCSPVTAVSVYIDPLSPIVNETVSFNGSAKSNDVITTWEWDFGDGSTETGQAVTHQYRSKGIYTVKLVVTNDCGENETSTRNVTVSEESVATGTVKCTSNQTGFAVYIDGDYKGHSYGETFVIIDNVPVGDRVVKIEKGDNYTPPQCEKTVTVEKDDVAIFDCQMTKIGECSLVTNIKIYADKLSPIIDETISFNGSANSNDPITTWEWDFGDGSTSTGQAVTHSYSKADIYQVVLKVINDCAESAISTRNVTVVEVAPPAESTSLTIEPMIDTDGNNIPRDWEVEIWVDGKFTKCLGPQTLTFGTDEFCDCESPWKFVPCELGTHTITLKKFGYEDKSISVYLEKDKPKTWKSPVMVKSSTLPTMHTVSIVVPVGSMLYVDGGSVSGTTTIGRLATIFNELRKE